MGGTVHQRSLFKVNTEHGGELGRGKRKCARPLATRRAMHVVFRARRSCLHRYAREIRELRQELEERYHVHTYEYSNNDNHLHLLLKGRTRDGLRAFFRVFAGQIAQLVGQTKLWLVPVYTRIVADGKAFAVACRYVIQNRLEAAGLVAYRPRSRRKTPGALRRSARRSPGL